MVSKNVFLSLKVIVAAIVLFGGSCGSRSVVLGEIVAVIVLFWGDCGSLKCPVGAIVTISIIVMAMTAVGRPVCLLTPFYWGISTPPCSHIIMYTHSVVAHVHLCHMYGEQCKVKCNLVCNAQHSTINSAHHSAVQCTLYRTVHCAVQSTMHGTEQCSVQCTTQFYVLRRVQCSVQNSAVYSAQHMSTCSAVV